MFFILCCDHRFIFEFLETAGVTRATASVLMDQCNKAISFLTTDERSGFRNGGNIQKFTDALKVWVYIYSFSTELISH